MPRRSENKETITDTKRKAIVEEMLRLHYLGDYPLNRCWMLTHPESKAKPRSCHVMARREIDWYVNSYPELNASYLRQLFAARTQKITQELRAFRVKHSNNDAKE